MNDHDGQVDDVAAVLDQVVELGRTSPEAELGAAVSRHISTRPTTDRRPDPETVAALRTLANEMTNANAELSSALDATSGTLSVMVDFNALLDDLGEPHVWTILGKLKDLFGGSP